MNFLYSKRYNLYSKNVGDFYALNKKIKKF